MAICLIHRYRGLAVLGGAPPANSKDGRNLAVIESWFASDGQYAGGL